MTIFSDDFSAGTVGQPVTGWSFATGFVYGDTDPIYKNRTAEAVNPGTTAVEFWRGFTETGPAEIGALFQYTAPPAAGEIWMVNTYFDASAWATRLILTAANKLKLNTKGGTTQWTSTTTLTPGSWYRIGYRITPGTTATNGAIEGALFAGLSTTPLETFSVTSIDLGATNAVTQVHFGKINSVDFAGTLRFNWARIGMGADATTLFAPPPLNPTSPVFPNSVLANPGGWTKQGSASSIAASLADSDDTTFIQSAGVAAGEEIVLPVNPLSGGDITCFGRYRRAPGETSGTLTIELRQGTTLIKALVPGTTAGVPAATTTWQNFSYTLTSSEAAAVTDRAALRYRVVAN